MRGNRYLEGFQEEEELDMGDCELGWNSEKQRDQSLQERRSDRRAGAYRNTKLNKIEFACVKVLRI